MEGRGRCRPTSPWGRQAGCWLPGCSHLPVDAVVGKAAAVLHTRGGKPAGWTSQPGRPDGVHVPVTAAAARFPKCSGLNNRNLSSPSSGDRKYNIEVWAGPGSLQRLRRWGLPAWCAVRGCRQSWRPLASSCIITMVSLCLHHHGPSSVPVCVSKSSFLNKTTGHWVRPHPNQQDLIFI